MILQGRVSDLFEQRSLLRTGPARQTGVGERTGAEWMEGNRRMRKALLKEELGEYKTKIHFLGVTQKLGRGGKNDKA